MALARSLRALRRLALAARDMLRVTKPGVILRAARLVMLLVVGRLAECVDLVDLTMFVPGEVDSGEKDEGVL